MEPTHLSQPAALAGPPRWYAVHTRSNFEKSVAAQCASKQLTAYVPAVTEIHRWKDRRKQIEIPVFPGYVFVHMYDSAENRLHVLRSQGAVRILGSGGEIEGIPDAEIDGIRCLIRSALPFAAHPFLCEGDQVRVKRGPLRGIEGFLTKIKAQSRLVLSVQMLARSVSTEVDCRDIEMVRRGASPARTH